jgi:hypothetical protein
LSSAILKQKEDMGLPAVPLAGRNIEGKPFIL